jgi:adenosylhomocysteine nucleosidase
MESSEIQRVLVCFALAGEARPFRAKLRLYRRPSVITTGMGQRNARQAIRDALIADKPAWVLSCGLAGGLNPALEWGAIVYDADDGFPLTPALQKVGAKPVRFHCSAQVVATAQAKGELWRLHQADAVDMESAVIRQECQSRQIPSATVRVISDVAEEDLPLDFNQYVDAQSRPRYAKILGAVLKRPALIGGLLRFQRRAQAAAGLLADALVRVLAL